MTVTYLRSHAWRKGNIEKNCLCVTVLCTVIMVHKGTSSSYRLVACMGFGLACFSSVFRAPLCLWSSWCYISIYIYIYIYLSIHIYFLKNFAHILLFTVYVAKPGGICPWRGWLTIVFQCIVYWQYCWQSYEQSYWLLFKKSVYECSVVCRWHTFNCSFCLVGKQTVTYLWARTNSAGHGYQCQKVCMCTNWLSFQTPL